MGKNTFSKLLDKESIIKRFKNGETVNKIRLDCNVTHKVIKLIVEKTGVVFNKHPKYTKWCKEDVIREAKKYKHRSHFMKGNHSAYNAAHRMNLKEAFEHMEPLGHVKSRLVYAYEFPDNRVYVGLTANKDKRHGEHMRDGRGPVNKHMNKIGIAPRYRMISQWYIGHSEAQELEKNTVDEYKQNGWTIMNTAPAGNLGGNLYKWNEDNLKEITLKYRTRYDMIKGDPNAYGIIIQKGWKHLFNHMEWEGNIKHTLEECIEEAKKYTCRQDFRKGRYDLYQWTYKHKHQEVVFAHMPKKQIPYKWTVEEAVNIMNQYVYLNDFIREQPRCHRFLSRKSNYKEITKHLKLKSFKHWDKEKQEEYSKSVTKLLGKSCTIYNEHERLEFDSLRDLERFFWDKGLNRLGRHRFKEGEIIKDTNYYFTKLKNNM
jgi:hypothetical protein